MRVIWCGLIVSCLSGQFIPSHPVPRLSSQQIENKKFIEVVPIAKLLQFPGRYHQKQIRTRGTVTRLELHLDDSKHFINFVFHLKKGNNRVLVFGRHDRTSGDVQMTTGRTVEVQGIFWQEREANNHRLFNNIEANLVTFYPPLTPDQAALPFPLLSLRAFDPKQA